MSFGISGAQTRGERLAGCRNAFTQARDDLTRLAEREPGKPIWT